MTKFEFKLAENNELESIIALARKTVERCHRSFIDERTLDAYLRSNHLKDYLKSNIENTWVLYKNDTILGFAVCIENVIDFMMINTDYQRQGYGTVLLKHCEDLLFKKYDVIALECFKKNNNAKKFYLANNWLLTEQYRDMKHLAKKIIYRKYIDSVEQECLVATAAY